MSYPSLSIIIPTYNGAQTLPELLAMLSVQTVPIQELIIVDSSSTDQTAAIVEEHGAELITIDKKEFDHGGTRSLAARRAQGEILVFFTQDAIPARKDALENLIKPFLEDKDISVCYGRQLPAFNANIFASHLRNFNYPPESAIRSLSDKKRFGLKTIFVSNSFSAYRRSVLAENGFFKNGLIFGEDTCTVGRILLSKKKIAYVAEACVYHSHNYSMEEEFQRYFDIGVLHSMEKWLLDTYGTAESRGMKFIRSEIFFLISERKFHLVPVSILRSFMKLIAYKAGRFHSYFPKRFVILLSMHKAWWKKKDGAW